MNQNATLPRPAIHVCPMDESNMHLVPRHDQPYHVHGKMLLSFAEGQWSYTEELFDASYIKRFPEEDLALPDYLSSPDKIVLMAFADGALAGTIRLSRAWNLYAFIDDIGVFPGYRRKGVGAALMAAAEGWAGQLGLKGLALEMQDINLDAAHFYETCGFVIGGANTMLYRNFGLEETAVFWYKPIG